MFEFQSVINQRLRPNILPEDVVRFTKRRVHIPESFLRNCHSTKYQTNSGSTWVKLNVSFDLRNQAVQLKEDATGYGCRVSDQGNGTIVTPTGLQRSGLPTGDYKLVEGYRDVYQLVR